MAKRKKKQSIHSRQKIAAAHRRNEFFYKFRNLITRLTGDPSVFKLIPEKEYDGIYLKRLHQLRISAAPGCNVPDSVTGRAKEFIMNVIKHNTIVYTENGPRISLDLFFTVGITLLNYIQELRDDEFPAAARLKKAMQVLIDDKDKDGAGSLRKIYERKVYELILSISMEQSNFQQQIYWIDVSLEIDHTGTPALYTKCSIKSFRPRTRQITIDSISRPLIEVCWGITNKGIKRLYYTAEQLGLTNESPDKQFPIYVQSHALHRMTERLDCVHPNYLHFFMFMALETPVFHRKENHTYLIELRLIDKKAGYLVAGIHENSVVVHTFLFMTHDGTPEGTKLQQMTGLGRLDKAYLEIDKLSTFSESDITGNAKLMELFSEAGCESLFEMNQAMFIDGKEFQELSVADRIHRYLTMANADTGTEIYDLEQMPVTAGS